MAVNKVVFGASTVIDISDSTVTDDSQVANGLVYYRADGTRHVGTASGGGGDVQIIYGEARVDTATGDIVVHLPSNAKSWLLTRVDNPGVYVGADTKIYQDGQYLATIGRAFVPISNIGVDPSTEAVTAYGSVVTSLYSAGYDMLAVSLSLSVDETEVPSQAYLYENTTEGVSSTTIPIMYDMSPVDT